MTFNFSMQAIDQVINSAAKTYYMSAGQVCMYWELPFLAEGMIFGIVVLVWDRFVSQVSGCEWCCTGVGGCAVVKGRGDSLDTKAQRRVQSKGW
jgi:hypothetical protein